MKLYVLELIKQRVNKKFIIFFRVCNHISEKDYFTNVYGLSRSILAVGTLLTLIFNSPEILFSKHLYNVYKTENFLEKFNLFFLFGYDYLWISITVAIIILITVILGYFPRITGIFHWWISYSFFSSAIIIDGGDQITSVLTFYIIPITLLDSRKNHWINNSTSSVYKNFIVFIVFVFIEIQMAILYLQAGMEKPYKVDEWLDGTAIYYWMNHNIFGASDWELFLLNPIFNSSILLSFINWGIIIFEIILFGAFFMGKSRKLSLLKYALLFHFLILLFHGLVSFFFSISAGLILYLIPKERKININRLKYVK